jgi:hypothetical protein
VLDVPVAYAAEKRRSAVSVGLTPPGSVRISKGYRGFVTPIPTFDVELTTSPTFPEALLNATTFPAPSCWTDRALPELVLPRTRQFAVEIKWLTAGLPWLKLDIGSSITGGDLFGLHKAERDKSPGSMKSFSVYCGAEGLTPYVDHKS